MLLDQHHQQHAGRPQHQREIYPGWRNPAAFVVVSDAYPTVTGPRRRPDPALRHVDRRKAPSATPSGAPSSWRQQVKAPGEAVRPVAVHGVLQALQSRGSVAGRTDRQEARNKGKTLYDVLYANGGEQVPLSDWCGSTEHAIKNHQRRIRRPSASTCRRACSRNTRVRPRPRPRPGPVRRLSQGRGLRWPVVDGKETLWRFREGYDPTSRRARA